MTKQEVISNLVKELINNKDHNELLISLLNDALGDVNNLQQALNQTTVSYDYNYFSGKKVMVMSDLGVAIPLVIKQVQPSSILIEGGIEFPVEEVEFTNGVVKQYTSLKELKIVTTRNRKPKNAELVEA